MCVCILCVNIARNLYIRTCSHVPMYLSYFRYGDKLEVAKKEGIKKEFITSTVIGALFLIIICTFALGFW